MYNAYHVRNYLFPNRTEQIGLIRPRTMYYRQRKSSLMLFRVMKHRYNLESIRGRLLHEKLDLKRCFIVIVLLHGTRGRQDRCFRALLVVNIVNTEGYSRKRNRKRLINACFQVLSFRSFKRYSRVIQSFYFNRIIDLVITLRLRNLSSIRLVYILYSSLQTLRILIRSKLFGIS